jgi:PX domain
MTQSTTTNTDLVYLNYDDWSPRYDAACFYTIRLNGYVWMTSVEQLNDLVRQQEQQQQQVQATDCKQITDSIYSMPKKCRLPTYYYKIIMYRGHRQYVIYRSYVQFEWLYHQLRRTLSSKPQPSNMSLEKIMIPHPLQGDRNDMVCNFLGYCWGVRQIQEWLDYIGQHHSQHSTTTTNDENPTAENTHLIQNNSKFAETRCLQLSYFLTTVLEQHGLSHKHANIIDTIYQFLELQSTKLGK